MTPAADLARKLEGYRASYERGLPEISDDAFDRLEDELRKLKPKHPYFKKVGTPQKKRQVELPFFMGSLAKIRYEQVARHADGFDTVMWSPKIDGVSALLEAGPRTVRLFSRGDGAVGQDISHLIGPLGLDKVAAVARTVFKKTRTVTLRLELVMPAATFNAKFKGEFRNPRNLVAGLVNANPGSVRKDVLKLTEYVVHEIMAPAGIYLGSGEHRDALVKGGVNIVPFRRLTATGTKSAADRLTALLEQAREQSKYTLDGLVLACWGEGQWPKQQPTRVAFKGRDEGYLAIIDTIEWNESRYGVFKPTAIFKTPVEIDGIRITRATAHNARFVFDSQLRVGTKVLVARSGDVIPFIQEVVEIAEKGKLITPKGYGETVRWNESRVDLIAGTTGSTERKALALAFFITTLGIKGIQANLLTPAVDAGIDTPEKLATATLKVLAETCKFGETRAAALIDGLDAAIRRAASAVLMVASGAFGRGFGHARADEVMQAVTHQELLTLNDLALRTKLDGNAAPTAIDAVILGRAQYKALVKAVGYRPPAPAKAASIKLRGKAFAFTGVRSSDLAALIETNGGKVLGSITKKATHVICADKKSSSSKMQRARELGVKIWSLQEATAKLAALKAAPARAKQKSKR